MEAGIATRIGAVIAVLALALVIAGCTGLQERAEGSREEFPHWASEAKRYGCSPYASLSSASGILTGLPVARSIQAWRVWPATRTSVSRSTS